MSDVKKVRLIDIVRTGVGVYSVRLDNRGVQQIWPVLEERDSMRSPNVGFEAALGQKIAHRVLEMVQRFSRGERPPEGIIDED